jgi:hypothetical protein
MEVCFSYSPLFYFYHLTYWCTSTLASKCYVLDDDFLVSPFS